MTKLSRRDDGQVVVFFALLLPVLFAMGAIVLDVGNWYVHKRHLQTQVDAAVFAAAPNFVGCFHSQAGANPSIANAALAYAGDTKRDGATKNLQVQQPNDVRVVLNGDRYWRSSDGTSDPASGYGLDYGADALAGRPADPAKMPCATSSLDAKATDDQAPLLWGLIPLTPSPKTHAKIEIHDVIDSNQMLPIAVPEVDPRAVAAIFVDEFNGNVLAALELDKLTSCPDPDAGGPLPAYPYKCWSVEFPSVLVNTDHIGVVTLVSRNDPNPNLSGTLGQICDPPGDGTGASELILCYGGAGNQSGLSMIHGYETGSGGLSLQTPIVRDVDLIDGNCLAGGDHSAPYFMLNGECSVSVQAIIDFGMALGPDPTAFPKCVHVMSNAVSGELAFSGDVADGSVFTGVITNLPEGSGRNVVNLTTESRNPSRSNCNQRITRSFPRVAAPYVADANSGPVQYLTLENTTFPVGLSNSTPKNSTPRPIRVTVGLQRPLELLDAREPSVMLRLGSSNSSQTRSLDCDDSNLSGPSGNHSNFRNEFKDGCLTWYRENFGDWSTPADGVQEWADIGCNAYQAAWGAQPPDAQFNNPLPNCMAIQTGVSAGQFRDALTARFASPCTPNNWPDPSASDAEVEDFFLNYNFTNDPRYITLVVADFTAFFGSGSSDPRPIKSFAGFYYTGSGAVFCPGDAPHPLGLTGSRARFDMWGHYVNIVEFSGSATPGDPVCDFTSTTAGNCVAVLVE